MRESLETLKTCLLWVTFRYSCANIRALYTPKEAVNDKEKSGASWCWTITEGVTFLPLFMFLQNTNYLHPILLICGLMYGLMDCGKWCREACRLWDNANFCVTLSSAWSPLLSSSKCTHVQITKLSLLFGNFCKASVSYFGQYRIYKISKWVHCFHIFDFCYRMKQDSSQWNMYGWLFIVFYEQSLVGMQLYYVEKQKRPQISEQRCIILSHDSTTREYVELYYRKRTG